MAATPYPIPRGKRVTDVLAGNGGKVYGPFSFKIFDIDDVEVVSRPQGAVAYAVALVTVQKLSAAALDHFTITFAENVPATTSFQVRGRRVAERSAGVMKGTMLNPDALERELSKISMQAQEARRDALPLDPDIQDGDTISYEKGRWRKGANALDIASAQAYAASALQSKDVASIKAEAAAGSATSAAGSSTLSGRFATAPEDEEVVPSSGLFSAFHWYRKTLAIWNNVIAGWSGAVHNAPLKATPSFADEFGFADSGDSWKIKKQTFGKLQEIFGVPIGTTIMVQGNGNTPPPGFLLHNGAAVTAAYPQLRAFLLANGANVDGSGNPIIEDMGGYFPRGWRPGQVVDSGRVFGSVQQDALQDHKHRTASAIADRVTPSWGTLDGTEEFTTNSGFYANAGVAYRNLSGGAKYPVDANGTPRVAAETRPANKTFTYWIKAYAADLVPGSADLAALLNNVQVLQTSVNSTGLKKGARASISSGTSLLYTGIPAGVSKITFNVRGVTFGSPQGTPRIRVGTPAGVLTSGYSGGYMVIAQQTGYATLPTDGSAIDMNASNSAMAVLNGQIIFTRVPGTNEWLYTGQFYATPGGYHFGMWQSGLIAMPGDFDRIQLTTIQGTAPMTAGFVWAEWETAA